MEGSGGQLVRKAKGDRMKTFKERFDNAAPDLIMKNVIYETEQCEINEAVANEEWEEVSTRLLHFLTRFAKYGRYDRTYLSRGGLRE